MAVATMTPPLPNFQTSGGFCESDGMASQAESGPLAGG